MTRQELAKAIFKTSYLTGQFTLRSGKTSAEYFDKYRFESQPDLLKEIARHSASLVPKGTQVLAGLELGGVPLATALGMEMGIPIAFVRKSAKTYGTCQIAEGVDLKGKNVCVIEDVITTGGQVVESTRELAKLGANITKVICVIYRGESSQPEIPGLKIPVAALFNMNELKNS